MTEVWVTNRSNIVFTTDKTLGFLYIIYEPLLVIIPKMTFITSLFNPFRSHDRFQKWINRVPIKLLVYSVIHFL